MARRKCFQYGSDFVASTTPVGDTAYHFLAVPLIQRIAGGPIGHFPAFTRRHSLQSQFSALCFLK
jgi:hypothetical protein